MQIQNQQTLLSDPIKVKIDLRNTQKYAIEDTCDTYNDMYSKNHEAYSYNNTTQDSQYYLQ
jgi:hypothetical protein